MKSNRTAIGQKLKNVCTPLIFAYLGNAYDSVSLRIKLLDSVESIAMNKAFLTHIKIHTVRLTLGRRF